MGFRDAHLSIVTSDGPGPGSGERYADQRWRRQTKKRRRSGEPEATRRIWMADGEGAGVGNHGSQKSEGGAGKRRTTCNGRGRRENHAADVKDGQEWKGTRKGHGEAFPEGKKKSA